MAVGPVLEDLADLGRILVVRCIKVESVLFAQCDQNCVCKGPIIHGALPAGNNDSPFINGERSVRNDKIQVKLHLVAESRAHGACTERIVKRKASRLDLVN